MLLSSRGHELYFGPSVDVLRYFRAIPAVAERLDRDKWANPAEILLEIGSCRDEAVIQDMADSYTQCGALQQLMPATSLASTDSSRGEGLHCGVSNALSAA